jgi:hypothetical protein
LIKNVRVVLRRLRRMGSEIETKVVSDLRHRIAEAEVVGVNVKQAWLLFDEAASLVKEGKEEDALTNVEKAYADLERKERLFKSSKSGFILGCVLLLVIIGLFVLFNFVNIEGLRSQKILTVPLFTIAWGLIGCATYITYTTYVKIRDKVFDWYDIGPYFFRFVLAVFFTTFTYVVAINGLINLPGTIGKEVKASIEASDVGPGPNKGTSETSESGNVEEKESNGTRNSLYDIKKNVSALTIEIGGNVPAYASPIKTGIVPADDKDDPGFYTPSPETDESRLPKEMVEDIKEIYDVGEEPKKSDEILKEIAIIDEELDDINKNTKRIKEYISAIIIASEVGGLETLGFETARFETLGFETDGFETGGETVKGGPKEKTILDDLERNGAEAGAMEVLKVVKEGQLDVALERETQAPLWESWIFILVAFFSGFSVEFGAGLIERFKDLLLSTAGGKKTD